MNRKPPKFKVAVISSAKPPFVVKQTSSPSLGAMGNKIRLVPIGNKEYLTMKKSFNRSAILPPRCHKDSCKILNDESESHHCFKDFVKRSLLQNDDR